jgi:multicomponent Na+:H+ antiporter subunit C
VTPYLVYSTGAALLVGLGLHGVVTRRHLVRQVLAMNVVGGGVFLFLVAVAHRNSDASPDPIPQALVLTGIVVAVSVSAFAVALARAIHVRTGRTTLVEDDLE